MKASVCCFAFVLALILPGRAEDITFTKARSSSPGDAKETRVHLTISDSGLTIRNLTGGRRASGPPLEIPYARIGRMSYGFTDRRRFAAGVAVAPILMLTKAQKHWLVIEPASGTTPLAILRLDKKEYRQIISALNAKSGKRVEVLEDPTDGSQDMDEIVPYQLDLVIAALRPAMAQHFCEAGRNEPGRVECKRSLSPRDSRGGGEKVVARLEPSGQGTRVRIHTSRGLGRDWSTPIYREMRKRLEGGGQQ